MRKLVPQKLHKGDKIAFVALSGNIEDENKLNLSKNFFEDRGYEVIFAKNILNQNRYLAGNDEEKIEELHKFFKNPEIKAIFCVRGGYGAIRLVEKIDYEIIKKNPKIFAGYSDVTALLAIIYKKTGLITYHAPMPYSDFSDTISNFTVQNFFKTIETNENLEFLGNKVYNDGCAEGILWGGNLSTLTSLCGTDFIPDEKFIFFTEDLCEPSYKIDRMFTQLFNIEKFRKNIVGIALGEFVEIEDEKYLTEIFTEIKEKYKIPMIGGFKISHAHDKITVPYGMMAKIGGTKCGIIVKR